MNTNLVQLITTVTLVTNTVVKWPVRWEPEPCPDGLAGCLVNHTRSVALTNSNTRTLVTEVYERTEGYLTGLNYRFQMSNVLKSRVEIPQTLVTAWTNGTPIVESNILSTKWGNSTNITVTIAGSNATNILIGGSAIRATNIYEFFPSNMPFNPTTPP